MFTFRVLILLATCLSWSLGDYCSICKDHTMCKYKGIGKNCIKPEAGGVTDGEKKEIVNLHNTYRRNIAKGLEHRGISGPFPKASNMREMKWDKQLQVVAQRWADQCDFSHDTCRDDKRFKVGQNIFISIQVPTPTVSWPKPVSRWYDEIDKYNTAELKSYRFEAATGHFSQIIWHDTYAIGCGRRQFNTSKIIYVCNYGPTGNWINSSVYEVGEPCSACPQGTVCKDGLCGKKKLRSNKRTSIDLIKLFRSENINNYEEEDEKENENENEHENEHENENENENEIDEKTVQGLEKIITNLIKLFVEAIRTARERI